MPPRTEELRAVDWAMIVMVILMVIAYFVVAVQMFMNGMRDRRTCCLKSPPPRQPPRRKPIGNYSYLTNAFSDDEADDRPEQGGA